jgi:hypothetical protein
VNANHPSPFPSAIKLALKFFLTVALATRFSDAASAQVGATLTWNPSADPSVAGYNIYYGGTSQQYTNMVSVGFVTNTTIQGLSEATPYFFAAKARSSSGAESDFSNEAAFQGVNTAPGPVHLRALPKTFSNDPLTYSLGSGAPAGVTINATNGIISWVPDRSYASTTNYVNVAVTDAVNPAMNITETVVIIIGDYLDMQPGSTAVWAGQSGSLPLIAAASGSVTNLQLALTWPSSQLLDPSLSFAPPILTGSLQTVNGQLLVQLQADPSQPLSGTNPVAQINFQTAPGTPSAILGIPTASGSGVTANGLAYQNVTSEAGEVVVVGNQPILRPQVTAAGGRTLSLYASSGNYQLQYATSLTAPVNWMPVTNFQQTNAAQAISLDSSNPFVIYRLEQQ